METFAITNLTFTYPQTERPALEDVSLGVNLGEFVTLCGKSGCGKTTLLKQLKSIIAPHGKRTGDIFFEGALLDEIDHRTQSTKIGFVHQSPDNQIVTDKVWHELAFGLESLGMPTPEIRLKVAEMASYFGIQTWFHKNVGELSGGQKQILNLAAIMVMQPSVLILDEPTSQLDPIAASDFLATIGKINRELGTTIIMTEHRLEEALPLSDRVIVMDNGRVIVDGSPAEAGARLKELDHGMFLAMPSPMRIYAGVDNDLECPVTVREGRKWLDTYLRDHQVGELLPEKRFMTDKKPVIHVEEVWYRYDKESEDVVRGLSMSVYPGEFYAIVGGNGTGKTTTLSLLSGINIPYRGEVRIEGKKAHEIDDSEKFNGLLGVLPQNPQALFVEKTVDLDLREVLKGKKLSKQEKDEKVRQVASLCELNHLLHMHPYDLSGGEQQRAALAKVLLLEPRILLLDEPTKGLDSHFKQKLAGILKKLKRAGVTIIMVSHDVEFCASHTDRCAMFFSGNIVTQNSPRAFFSGNSFYTTAANRICRHVLAEAVTAEDLIVALGGKPEENIYLEELEQAPLSYLESPDSGEGELNFPGKQETYPAIPLWRRVAGGFILFVCAVVVYMGLSNPEMVTDFVGGDIPAYGMIELADAWKYAVGVMALTAAVISGMMLLVYRPKEKDPNEITQMPKGQRRLEKRTIVAAFLILFMIPLTIYVGIFYLNDRKYYFISMLIILETIVPFVMIYEGRKPQARELMVIAVLCAVAVAGRAAFFWLPQFKPVVALVIIAGVALGGEAGFLVGAMSALISNFFFGQGPWTPWQMFAFGIIGFLAGVLFKKGILRRNLVALCVFGGLAAFFIYGGIMNSSMVLLYQENPKLGMFLVYYLTGVPFDMIHASATIFFLWAAAKPMLEKLDRIKTKYGLIEDRE